MDLMRDFPVSSRSIRSVLCVLWVLLLTACSSEPVGRPNVVIVMIDALRDDHLGCYGYERDTSPHIDALAAESVFFENAFAQSPWTKPSIPTLFTSLYPIQHGVYEGETPGSSGFLESDILAEEFRTVAESFQEAGFRTVGFVQNAHLLASQGFAQGFDVYQQGNYDAPEINRKFLEYVDEAPGEPFFAYLHYLDAHWPFMPERRFADRYVESTDYQGVFARDNWRGLRDRINEGTIQLADADVAQLVALHDGGIREMDHYLGALLEALRQRDLMDQTLIVLTSDHGEELMDHGKVGHGGTLFEEVVRIPLMVRRPGGAGPQRVATPARLLDVYPTLLASAGIEAPAGLEGRDLLDGSRATPEVVSETRVKRRYRVSLRDGSWKYVATYRAASPSRIDPDRSETFGLQPGMRLKLAGLYDDEGRLIVDKVRVIDSNDDDVEVSDRVSRLAGDRKTFQLGPFRVVPARRLSEDRGGALLSTLQDGDWVKAEGDVSTERTLVADKIVALAKGDRETELEGVLQAIHGVSSESARGTLGSADVVINDDTRIRGGSVRTAAPAATSLDPGENPFSPQRLLSREGLTLAEELYDLASDPGEARNRAVDSAGVLEKLRGKLERWLQRMAESGAGRTSQREALDDATIEHLKTLGYIE